MQTVTRYDPPILLVPFKDHTHMAFTFPQRWISSKRPSHESACLFPRRLLRSPSSSTVHMTDAQNFGNKSKPSKKGNTLLPKGMLIACGQSSVNHHSPHSKPNLMRRHLSKSTFPLGLRIESFLCLLHAARCRLAPQYIFGAQ
jgi:hypothetical protein